MKRISTAHFIFGTVCLAVFFSLAWSVNSQAQEVAPDGLSDASLDLIDYLQGSEVLDQVVIKVSKYNAEAAIPDVAPIKDDKVFVCIQGVQAATPVAAKLSNGAANKPEIKTEPVADPKSAGTVDSGADAPKKPTESKASVKCVQVDVVVEEVTEEEFYGR